MLLLLNNIKNHVLKVSTVQKSISAVFQRGLSSKNSKQLLTTTKNFLSSRPLLSNCITYGLLYSGSEFLQQTILKNVDGGDNQEYDFGSIFRYWVIGTLVFPVILFHWYRWLDARYVGLATQTIVKKMMLDQFVISPPILAIFYILMSAMEGKDDLFQELREKLVTTFKSSCVFWMPAQAINFLFIPSHLRVVYVGTCSLLWVNILCLIKRGQPSDNEVN